jgi:energy-coupling factor transporter ATP-binding protein EcfA2
MKTPTNSAAVEKVQERLNRRLIEHTRFDEALQRIESELRFPTDTKILLVVGPTGVGKTRLRKAVEKLIFDLTAQKLIEDRGCVPFVSFEIACASTSYRFNWRQFYEDYMEQLEAPFTPTGAALSSLPLVDGHRGPEHAVLSALRHRRPVAALLDEANHFAVVASGKVFLEQMTRIKSFANRSGVLHICFGTYELAQMANLSGQLARRCEIIHFARYRSASESESDFAAFKKVARTFHGCVPGAVDLDLGSRAEYLHQRSIGCVGILKTWLVKALGHAMKNGRKEIKFSDLEDTAMPVDRLQRILNETIEGEASLRETQEEMDVFLSDLGHKEPKEPDAPPQGELFGHSPAIGAIPGKPARNPGEPAAKRYPSGGAFNGQLGKMAV